MKGQNTIRSCPRAKLRVAQAALTPALSQREREINYPPRTSFSTSSDT
jgi:hypothetical protein